MKDWLKIMLLSIIAITVVVQTIIYIRAMQRMESNPEQTSSTISLQPSAVQPQLNTSQNTFEESQALTTMTFEEFKYDFGTIRRNERVSRVFKFKNTGQHPLVIRNASGSCGCTVPEWPREPIPPGGTGVIKVEFDASKAGTGQQNKTIAIHANTSPSPVILNISAFVLVE